MLKTPGDRKLIDSMNRGGLYDPTEFLIRLVTNCERVINMLSSDTSQVISIERLNIEVHVLGVS